MNTVSIETKNALIEATRKWIDRAEKVYGRHFGMPKVSFGVKGAVAGYAYYDRHEVDFNVQIFEENRQDFLNRTVPHEVAHRIAVMVYGREQGKGHGKAWKYVMKVMFGLEPTRCHSYEVQHLKTRQVRR